MCNKSFFPWCCTICCELSAFPAPAPITSLGSGLFQISVTTLDIEDAAKPGIVRCYDAAKPGVVLCSDAVKPGVVPCGVVAKPGVVRCGDAAKPDVVCCGDAVKPGAGRCAAKPGVCR